MRSCRHGARLIRERSADKDTTREDELTVKSSRIGTCVHEAGHAIISYLLGVRFLHMEVLDEARGEVVPESTSCSTCIEYYERSDPTTDDHSRAIQDDLRRQAAVATAGEIAENELGPGTVVDESELAQDRALARCRASFIHLWADGRCRRDGSWESNTTCSLCDAFLSSLRSVVKAQLLKPTVSAQVVRLAESLEVRGRLHWDEVVDFLKEHLDYGSIHIDALPGAPPGQAKN